VGLVRSLLGWMRGGVPASDLRASHGIDAYGLPDELEGGDLRAAAWSAYALQTFGDKLVAACSNDGLVPFDTAAVARAAYELAGHCVGIACADEPVAGGDLPAAFPHWSTPLRSHAQLVAMKDTLEDLRTYLAYELRDTPQDDPFRKRLAAIDAKLTHVDLLWIERPPPEIRGGIGDTLGGALADVYRLGQQVARERGR
jgi:hypothetical protein